MHIHLFTDITGFPFGTAAASRIRMIGKSLSLVDVSFTIYTSTIVYNKFNILQYGTFENIEYYYLHNCINLNKSKIIKVLLWFKGVSKMFLIIKSLDSTNDCVYIYSQGRLFNVFAVLFARLFKVKIVQEINEWDYKEQKGFLKKYILKYFMIKKSNGAIAISNNIIEKINEIKDEAKNLLLPVLEDSKIYNNYSAEPFDDSKYCFWMGLVDGYWNDIDLLLKAFCITHKAGCFYELKIAGPISQGTTNRIYNTFKSYSIDLKYINILGYITEEDRIRYCKYASFFVVPLWNDDKSSHRFPTKIASFMFSGNPILTCNVGEVGRLLSNEENVIYFNVGDETDLANKIMLLFDNKELRDRIKKNSFDFAVEHFDFRMYSQPLYQFFKQIIG